MGIAGVYPARVARPKTPIALSRLVIEAGRRRGDALLGVIACLICACVGWAVARSARVEVSGVSMWPTLHPGDRVLVLKRGGPWRRSRPGDLVTFRDPRPGGGTLVKRFAAVTADGAELVGDNAAASTDSRVFGALPRTALAGRAVYRYFPSTRAGRVGRSLSGPSQLRR